MIDFHVHLAGTGCDNSGCTISPSLRRSLPFVALRLVRKIPREQLKQNFDEWWAQELVRNLSSSECVDQGVGLCLDQVYDANGICRPEWTHLHTPNDWGAKVARESRGRILLGASVHPYRPDALKELERVESLGAVLIKWLPSTMGIDPADKRCIPFYDALRSLRLPLLCHTEKEHTIGDVSREWSDKNAVDRLRLPLSRGVTVMAAHSGLPHNLDTLLSLMREYPTLWAESSGLFNHTRAREALLLFRQARYSPLRERLLFGSDWPVPAFPLLVADALGWKEYRRVSTIKNPFDKEVAIKKLLGFSPEDFLRNEEQFFNSLDRERPVFNPEAAE